MKFDHFARNFSTCKYYYLATVPHALFGGRVDYRYNNTWRCASQLVGVITTKAITQPRQSRHGHTTAVVVVVVGVGVPLLAGWLARRLKRQGNPQRHYLLVYTCTYKHRAQGAHAGVLDVY